MSVQVQDFPTEKQPTIDRSTPRSRTPYQISANYWRNIFRGKSPRQTDGFVVFLAGRWWCCCYCLITAENTNSPSARFISPKVPPRIVFFNIISGARVYLSAIGLLLSAISVIPSSVPPLTNLRTIILYCRLCTLLEAQEKKSISTRLGQLHSSFTQTVNPFN